MSMPQRETVECPKCGKKLTYTMWQSINTQMDFAIPDIISGKLFEVVCDKCGQKLHIMYPILFNDMIHHIMISYVMPGSEEEAMKGFDFSRSLGYRLRIVTSQESLREKTAIINAGLDDRIVELMKIIVLAQTGDQLEGKDLGGIYFIPDEKQPVMEFVIAGKPSYLNIVMDGYRFLEETYRDAFAETDDDTIIDREWALAFLDAHPLP